MAEYLGPGMARVDKVKMPGDMRDRLASPHVHARAESIEENGLLQRPIVRKSDMLLIAGGDRVAAIMYLEHEQFPCEYWECNDDEVEIIRSTENAHRRHDTGEQARELQRIVQIHTRINAEKGIEDPQRTAVDKVAAEHGIKPGTVERRMREAEKQQRDEDAGPADNTYKDALPEGFQDWGLQTDVDFRKSINAICTRINEADLALRKAQGAALGAAQSEQVQTPAAFKRIRTELHDLAAELRDLIPVCICVYCKTLVKCGVCGETHYNTAEQLRAASERLLDWERPMVVSGGQMVAAPQQEEPEPPSAEEHDLPEEDDNDLAGLI